ncbi:MAG: hypothetical protein DCC68_26810 [Planctomycetota bacterium]|nr:MAG: hypothetical protein DCC68_26810 [Planctomycetota bacterium]
MAFGHSRTVVPPSEPTPNKLVPGPSANPHGPPSSLIHVDSADWIGEPLRDGRICTVCRIWGTFVGDRPATPDRRPALDTHAGRM